MDFRVFGGAEVKMEKKNNNQVVGNAGLYYVSYELSKRGWNVMPTSRNAKGVDLLIYSQDAKRTHTVQIKALSKKNPVPLGTKEPQFLAHFVIICVNVMENPHVFIASPNEISGRVHVGKKEGKMSYWLQPKDYNQFSEKWDKIGEGY